MRQIKITTSITNRDSPALEMYLKDMAKTVMIKPEEEIELAQKIKQGDEAALNKLINANLRFVVSVAKKYQGQGMALTDLISEGNLGLITAAKRFDETKGFKFISYAVWWIRQGILTAMAESTRTVYLPLNVVGQLNKIHKTSSKLAHELQREPTAEEIAELSGISLEKVLDTSALAHYATSFDAPVQFGHGDEGSLYEMFDSGEPPPDDVLIHESLKSKIEALLASIPERPRAILELSFGLNGQPAMTLKEIGEKFDLTRERVRQLRDGWLKKLRARATLHLREYR